MTEQRVIYVTKWWASQGILKVLADITGDEGNLAVFMLDGEPMTAWKNGQDWHTSLADARKQVLRLSERRQRSLERQLERLRQLRRECQYRDTIQDQHELVSLER